MGNIGYTQTIRRPIRIHTSLCTSRYKANTHYQGECTEIRSCTGDTINAYMSPTVSPVYTSTVRRRRTGTQAICTQGTVGLGRCSRINLPVLVILWDLCVTYRQARGARPSHCTQGTTEPGNFSHKLYPSPCTHNVTVQYRAQ